MKKMFFALLMLLPLSAFAEFKEFLTEEAKYERFLKDPAFQINSPYIQEDAITFFYVGKAKSVLLSGDFNGWAVNTMMEKRSNNVWIYTWDQRLNKGKYRYKFIVDNIWIEDPRNTNIIIDSSGQNVTYFTVGEDFIPNKTYPLAYDESTYIFHYADPAAQQVMLVGDFNNYNPYSHSMKEKSPGVFELAIKVKPGVHIYCFVIDGEWHTDPNNLRQYRDETGRNMNVFYVAGQKKPY